MTKKKGIASKLFIGLTGLTLLSCCFLGTTFARYTSGGSGTAEVGVALWDVNFSTDGTATATTTKLSPSMAAYNAENDSNRAKSTGKFLVATITNNSEVAADVTITYDSEATYGFVTGGATDFGDGFSYNYETMAVTPPTEAQVDELFSIVVFTGTTTTAEGATPYTQAVNLPAKSEEAAAAQVYIFVEITWTSDDDTWGVSSDALDTWVGENIEKLTYNLTFTATQASEIPDSTVGG